MKHEVPDAKRRIYTTHQKDFMLWHNLLYLKVMPKRSSEDVLVFVVSGLKWQAGIDGCHCYLGHQGRDRMLSLLRERFWWLGMAQRMMLSVCNCEKCRIFEAKPKIPPWSPSSVPSPWIWYTSTMCPWRSPWALRKNRSLRMFWWSRTILHTIPRHMSPTTTPHT